MLSKSRQKLDFIARTMARRERQEHWQSYDFSTNQLKLSPAEWAAANPAHKAKVVADLNKLDGKRIFPKTKKTKLPKW